ncbi:DUF6082 family protein [Streptomyces sp. CB02460]|uniref:DUF6082 family protein n=1 Tax=Streptomyces sp. CB02460 TaxID=1703941 RepID=UPI00093DFED3|nr:DUF6082 family protein [Streptomyces sp. CB02460]OKJ72292.1 peptide transporter permease SapC [Streptomyces sp. CB02460]
MKLTTAVLVAGATISIATTVVGVTRLRQNAQPERNEVAAARNQIDWLEKAATNPDLAKLWKPEDMEVEEYMSLLAANQLICALSLRDRLGLVRKGQLSFLASMAMSTEVCQRYWERFGGLRAQEAKGDWQAEHFTRVLDEAAKNLRRARTAAA